MLLVLASIADAAAVAFAEELADATAVSVITCRDLAEHATQLRFPGFEASSLTVGGQVLSVSAITGVINLLPAIFPAELVFYPPEEQEYQASEFHALLAFFLTALAAPVVNRASALSLNGPYANPLGWHHLARGLGLPVAPIRLDTNRFVSPFAAPSGVELVEASCLGGQLIGPSAGAAGAHTLALARAAGVEYLRAVYTPAARGGLRFLSAHTTPDLRHAATRQGLRDYFARPAWPLMILLWDLLGDDTFRSV